MKWAGVLLLLPITACGGEADIPAIEDEIETWAREDLNARGRITADCPDSMEWRTGDDFHCILTDQTGSVRVTVTMENDAGDVTWMLG